MLPEVFECPQCQRQFVYELVETATDHSIYCPQCKAYLGEKDLTFVLINEIDELTERLQFERDRLERDRFSPALRFAPCLPLPAATGTPALKTQTIDERVVRSSLVARAFARAEPLTRPRMVRAPNRRLRPRTVRAPCAER